MLAGLTSMPFLLEIIFFLNHLYAQQKQRILELISNIVLTLCDGELLQLSNQQHTDCSEKDYFEIIHKKTAILFSTCTELGGLSIIKWIQTKDFSAKNIQFITQFIREEGGIAYAEKQMAIYKNKALKELSYFKNGEIKYALIACAEYATVRNH